jgi:hypothetical protein
MRGEKTIGLSQERKSGGEIQATGNLSPRDANLGLSGKLDAHRSKSANESLQLKGDLKLMVSTQSKTPDDEYRWIIAPNIERALEGRPWDPTAEPRLRLIDDRHDRTRGIPPTVRLEARCCREDLLIDSIVLKDTSAWENAKSRLGFHNRYAAAECYIRDRLSKEGLYFDNLHDPYGRLTLAATIAKPGARE